MPQSHVSESVALLVKHGLVQSARDPVDKRRTIVRVTASHPRHVARAAMTSVDDALSEALKGIPADQARHIITTLDDLANRLRPASPGPILDQLSRARDERLSGSSWNFGGDPFR
jgi:DNA-binding MarR family transcriptional regulator